MSAAEVEKSRRLAERTRKRRKFDERAAAQSDDLLAAIAGRSAERSEQLAADILECRQSSGISHEDLERWLQVQPFHLGNRAVRA
jgi:hypothetical protein